MKKVLPLILFFSFSLIAINTFSKNKEDESETVDNSVVIDRIGNTDIEVIIPSVIFTFWEAEIKLKFKNPQHTKLLLGKNKLDFIINGEDKELTFVNGEASFMHKFDKDNSLSIFTEEFSFDQKVTTYPLWAILLLIALLLFWIVKRRIKKN